MFKHYNRVAGQSVERLAALSDGVFAVAMTLLVLDLRTPAAEAIHSEADLWQALLEIAPKVLVYLMSFLTLGIFWVGQQTHLNFLRRCDRNLAWIYLAFLFIVAMLPFATALMTEFFHYRVALLVYWVNLAMFGAILFVAWRYAMHAELVEGELPPEIRSGIERRIFIGQALYAFGAALCLIDTRLSIGFIFLVQLNYAIAPQVPLLSRL